MGIPANPLPITCMGASRTLDMFSQDNKAGWSVKVYHQHHDAHRKIAELNSLATLIQGKVSKCWMTRSYAPQLASPLCPRHSINNHG
eukprot:412630-Pelagomonas_calceolata.AAC.2